MIDESEVLTPADRRLPHRQTRVSAPPSFAGHEPSAKALRRIDEGAASDPHEGRGRDRRTPTRRSTTSATIKGLIRKLRERPTKSANGGGARATQPADLVHKTADLGRLPVVNFAAGGIAMPADAAR